MMQHNQALSRKPHATSTEQNYVEKHSEGIFQTIYIARACLNIARLLKSQHLTERYIISSRDFFWGKAAQCTTSWKQWRKSSTDV